MGMILGARDLKVKEPFFKTGYVLNIEVYKNMSDGTLANFEGKIFVNKKVSTNDENKEPLASGRVNVISICDEDKHKLFDRE